MTEIIKTVLNVFLIVMTLYFLYSGFDTLRALHPELMTPMSQLVLGIMSFGLMQSAGGKS
jgi:type III secretory pathway component EscU